MTVECFSACSLQWRSKNCQKEKLTLPKKCPYSELFWSTFFPHFPTFGLNTDRYSPYLVRIRANVGKMRTRITPNTDTFYAVWVLHSNHFFSSKSWSGTFRLLFESQQLLPSTFENFVIGDILQLDTSRQIILVPLSSTFKINKICDFATFSFRGNLKKC